MFHPQVDKVRRPHMDPRHWISTHSCAHETAQEAQRKHLK
ncbi:MAG: hypothetical protein OJF51_001085 [Nitrospira sp.]|nr:MAG: hypothetical protein OJF51_001085 [Nitrospira sp.]